ncbi:MFS transporter [Streptomyces vinaceus]|uniref:MFS transporter n=1 Tax=Streptomyces vinaceus TaxID=1960 RepID=UPI00380548CE
MTDVATQAEPAGIQSAAGHERLLAQKHFLMFWFGQTVSRFGNGAYQVALGWSVYELSGSAAAMGTLLALNILPEILLLLVGGALADRIPRRSVILAADTVAGLIMLALALTAASGHLTFWLLAVSAMLLGITGAFYGPAYASMNQDLVSGRQFRKANSFFTASGNLARLTGPLAAGLLYAAGGATAVFALNAASFAIAAIAMLFTTPPHGRSGQAPRRRQSMRRALTEGLTHTRKTAWILIILATSLVTNCLCLAPYTVLLPALVRETHAGISTLGLLSAVEIAMVMLSALAIGRLRAASKAGYALLALAACLGLGTLTLSAAPHQHALLFAGAALVGIGLSFDVVENTLLQTLVPQHLLSRVYSVNMVASYSLLPLAYALTGVVAKAVGMPAVLGMGGAVLVILCATAACHPEVKKLNAASW